MKTFEMNTSRNSSARIWFGAVAVTAALALGSVTGAWAQAPAADQSAAPATTAPAPGADQSAAPATTPPAPGADQGAAPAAPAAGMQANGDAPAANPYGFDSLWDNGGFIDRAIIVILAIMSLGTWYILFTRLWDQQRLMNQGKTVRKSFWTAGSLKEGMAKLEANSAYRAIVQDGLKAAEHHEGKLTDRVDLNEWVTMSLQRSTDAISAELQQGIAFLASAGSTAPFVGLFGTVVGIIHALIGIGIAGQASIDKVAGPVGEALIMTALGLAVAVPAVLGYNWIVRRNKVALEDVRNFSADVHAVLVSGGSLGAKA